MQLGQLTRCCQLSVPPDLQHFLQHLFDPVRRFVQNNRSRQILPFFQLLPPVFFALGQKSAEKTVRQADLKQ